MFLMCPFYIGKCCKCIFFLNVRVCPLLDSRGSAHYSCTFGNRMNPSKVWCWSRAKQEHLIVQPQKSGGEKEEGCKNYNWTC